VVTAVHERPAVSDRNRLASVEDDVQDIAGYLPRLRAMLFEQGDGGGHRHKVVGSPAPWNDPPGELLMAIHAESRRLAGGMAAFMREHPRPRGSTDAGTVAALREIAARVRRLETHLASSEVLADWPLENVLDAVARAVHDWSFRCREQLDELRPDEEPWTRAPGGLRCPNPWRWDNPDGPRCDRALWLAPGWAYEQSPAVYCRRCRADDGGPYGWPNATWLAAIAD
jgi:hypothetical protein